MAKRMKRQKRWMLTAILTICGLSAFLCACEGTGTDHPHVAGTLEEPITDSAPTQIKELIERASRFRQHEILNDSENSIAVFNIDEVDTTSTEGYGIVVVKGARSTTFTDICNTFEPEARYNSTTGDLWLTSSVIHGTGVHVEQLYQIRFHDDGKAYIAHTFEPFDLQQQLCQRIGYAIDDQQVTLYDGRQLLTTVTNSVTDMGGFDDEQPLWIGDQIEYDLSEEAPHLMITPGVKFTTGLVLTYDDMPTLRAPLTVGAEGTSSIGDLKLAAQP